jgi:fructuronate reductase/mannitol 2-dehydrogenase
MDAAIADPAFGAYVARMMREEIAPLLPAVPGIDLRGYQAALLERFANPAIADRLSRLCRNGSAKVPAHVLTSIGEARATGRPHALLTLAVAGWCRYLRGADEAGRTVVLDDPAGRRLQALARAGGDDPRGLLADGATFGALGAEPGFASAVERDLDDIAASGVRAVVAARAVADGRLAAA